MSNEIKCPKCGEIFTISESDYESIVKQIRDKEFATALKEKESQFKKEKDLEVKNVAVEKDSKIAKLENELKSQKAQAELDITKAVAEKEKRIAELENSIKLKESEQSLKEAAIKEKYEKQLKEKDEAIDYYKDLKARQSTKMLGETLEQHCEIVFNQNRALGFPNAYFEKDNDARTGSKGDYIFRDYDDGVEYISIMFEMKNEMETTQTKKKNEDFFKELDKDRNEKGCEYAVLVSMLEADSEYYNGGIVDVSYKYPKMYVVRPQFFLPIITLLRNAARTSLADKRALVLARQQNIDVANFEDRLNEFKEKIGKNVQTASKKFKDAIEEIDKTIGHLQKVKDNLMSSERQLLWANDKAEDLTIKSLTKDNPTMAKAFADAKNGQ